MKISNLNVNKLFTGFEKVIVILVLFYATSPQALFLGGNSGSTGQGNLISQSVWAGIYVVMLFFILIRLNSFVNVLSREKLLLILVALTMISVIWSGFPTLSFRKSFALLMTTMIGIYIGMRFNTERQLNLLTIALSIAAVLSIFLIIVNPNLGIQETRLGEWRGIYHQKGALGRYMALGTVALLILIISSKRHRLKRIFIFSSMIYLMFMAKSVTAIVSFFVVILTIVILKYYWKRWGSTLVILYTLLIFLTVSIFGLLILSQAEFLTGLADKDTTLTGRTKLWNDLYDISKERFLLGFGYNGFWLGWNGPSAEVWLTNQWEPNHAHNGFFDVFVDLGIIGLSMLLFHLGMNIFGAWRLIRVDHRSYVQLWPFLYFEFILINSFTQSILLTQNSLFWIIYVAITANITMELHRMGRERSRNSLGSKFQKAHQVP